MMPSPLSDIAWILLILLVCPFPVSTDRSVRRFPWVTATLVTVNVVCFLLSRQIQDTSAFAVNPLDRFGLIPRHPEAVKFVTYLFMHQNVSHLLWNMGFLWLFGPSVEDAVGRPLYALLYFGGGIAAGLLNTATVMIFASNQTVAYMPLIGASGAVSAILGIYAVRFYRSRIRIYWAPSAFFGARLAMWEAPALAGLGVWLVQNIIGAIISLADPDRGGIAYWAHIGGFVFGIAVAQFADLLGEGKKEYLVHEARAAIARGGAKSADEAMHKYRLALQRRPDDREARTALADMAHRYPEKSSLVRSRLSEEYAALIEHSFTRYQPAQALVWIEEARRLGLDWNLSAPSLLMLAEYLERRGNSDGASKIYHKLIETHPASREAREAYLDLATLQLNRLDHPAEAVRVLREFISRGPAA
ncbi:MAG: rhomboid family intramembrane serine protease [Capsulimonadaceae bacterium]|nr:rhomboid family intramembrane serine protease [Capsulimonadaceae bacterium]